MTAKKKKLALDGPLKAHFPMKRKGSTCSRALCAVHVRPQPGSVDFCIEHDTAFREATGLKALPKAAVSPEPAQRGQLALFQQRAK